MMVVQAGYFIATCLLNPHLTLTLQTSKLQDKCFASFWALVGKVFANDFPSPALDNIITQHTAGRVLDIGPGSGLQLKRFEAAAKQGRIDPIYGVEPGLDMHAPLKAEAARLLGQGSYVVLSCGAQPGQLVPVLAKEGLLGGTNTEGSFDTVVLIRALCGIPEPRKTLALFYRLLKPGGCLVFFEHVANSGDRRKGGSGIARLMQRVYMLLGWSFLAGGCELTRDTEQFIIDAARQDGGWAVKEIYHRNVWGCVPEVYGYVQKKKHQGL